MNREPAVIIGAIEAVIIAAIGLIGVMLEWEPALTASAVGAASAIVAFAGALVTRGKVYSPATHDAAVQEALYTPVPRDG